MKVFQAKNYVEFIKSALSQGQDVLPRGAIKALAERLRCHPTFISQILLGKAHLSHEQAIQFCVYVQLLEDETEYFIDLLNRDRAGNLETKKYFERILTRKTKDRGSLQKRAQLNSGINRESEILYFQNYIHSLIHAALHLPGHTNADALHDLLGISKVQINESLQLLKLIGLAAENTGKWKPTEKTLHVGRDSPLNRNYHSNLRLKTATALLDGVRSSEHTHFSSIFSISKEDVEQIREVLLTTLQTLRMKMAESDSERLFVLSLDYFPAEVLCR